MGDRGLTVGLLLASTGGGTTKLLGLTPTGISDDEGAVVVDKEVLDLGLGGLVDVLGVVCDNGPGDGLPDGKNLCNSTTARRLDPDLELCKPLLAQKQNGLVQLEAQNLGRHKLERAPVDTDLPVPVLCRLGKCDSRRVLLLGSTVTHEKRKIAHKHWRVSKIISTHTNAQYYSKMQQQSEGKRKWGNEKGKWRARWQTQGGKGKGREEETRESWRREW